MLTNEGKEAVSFLCHFRLQYITTSCWFANSVYCMLYQIFSVLFLQPALDELEQQGYGIYVELFL